MGLRGRYERHGEDHEPPACYAGDARGLSHHHYLGWPDRHDGDSRSSRAGWSDLQLPVCGDQGNPAAEPIVTKCPEFFPARGAQIFEVPGTGPRTITLDFVLKLGAFANELAAFKVDDALGSIGSLKPGDAGYEAAAFARAQTDLPAGLGPSDRRRDAAGHTAVTVSPSC